MENLEYLLSANDPEWSGLRGLHTLSQLSKKYQT